MSRFPFYLLSLLGFLFITLSSNSCSKEDDPKPAVVPAPGIIPAAYDTAAALSKAEMYSFTVDGKTTTVEQAYVYTSAHSRQTFGSDSHFRLDLVQDSSAINSNLVGKRLAQTEPVDANFIYYGTNHAGLQYTAANGETYYTPIVYSEANAEFDTETYYHTIKKITYLGYYKESAYYSIEGEFKFRTKDVRSMVEEYKDVTGTYRKIWKARRK
jgi:hypothetical protein